MNSYLLRNLSGITSASIEKYLLFTGWVRDDTFNSTRMWVFKSKSDPEFKIAVPASEKATDFCSPLTGVTSDSWDTPAGHRVYDACRGFSASWVCRGSGASIVSSTSC